MNKHVLGLQEKYFELVKNGVKIYEGRLNDEKRKSIVVGDIVSFFKDPDRVESFEAIVTNKYLFSSFKEMLDNIEVSKLGFFSESKEEIEGIYRKFYSLEDESKYGVVILEVKRV